MGKPSGGVQLRSSASHGNEQRAGSILEGPRTDCILVIMRRRSTIHSCAGSGSHVAFAPCQLSRTCCWSQHWIYLHWRPAELVVCWKQPQSQCCQHRYIPSRACHHPISSTSLYGGYSE